MTFGGAGWTTVPACSPGCLGCASWVYSAVSLGAFAASRCAVAFDYYVKLHREFLAWKIDVLFFFF